MGIYVTFYHYHSPNMVMSRDSGYKFRKNFLRLILYLNLRKITKFGGNWLKNKKVTGKKQNSGWKPSAYRVNPIQGFFLAVLKRLAVG